MKKSKPKQSKEIQSPYLLARREWNERYGDYIQSAKVWRQVGVVSLLIAAASVGGITYFAGQNKLIPYVIEVDQKGATVRTYEATQMQNIDQRVVRAQLAQFIKDIRTISPDSTVMKNAIKRIYTHLSNSSQAATFINEYFQKNNPFDKAQEYTTSVDILQLLPLSEKNWQIEWVEQKFGRDGKDLGKTNYTATILVSVGNKVDELTILDNPIGLAIENIHWSKDFQAKKEAE